MKQIIVFLTLQLFVASGNAHHNASAYDFSREVNVQGTVITFRWANPHVYIDIETLDSNNTLIIRRVEGPAPVALSSIGWNEQSIMPGEIITINANPASDQNSTDLMGNAILKEGGDYLPMGGMRLQEALKSR